MAVAWKHWRCKPKKCGSFWPFWIKTSFGCFWPETKMDSIRNAKLLVRPSEDTFNSKHFTCFLKINLCLSTTLNAFLRSFSASAGCAFGWNRCPTCFCLTRRGRWVRALACPNGVQSSGRCHVFLPLCQGQSVPCQANMENKPEELQLCFKTRGSFEAVLAHKPWPHLAVSCNGRLVGAHTRKHTHKQLQAHLPGQCHTTNSLKTHSGLWDYMISLNCS